MNLRQLIVRMIQLPQRIRLSRSLASLSIAASSDVNYFRVKGRVAQSRLTVGDACICNAMIAFDRPGATVEVGNRTFIGSAALVAAERITIGDDVLISWDVTIVDHESHSLNWAHRAHDVTDWRNGKKDWTHVRISPVSVGNKVWIGFGAKILRGVSIGEGAVIAAGSVVTRSVPEWTVVAGVPAKVIKEAQPCD